MTDIEIPDKSERRGHYRFFEILPLTLSVSAILLLFVLSIFNVTLAAFFVLIYLFVYLSRAIGVAIGSLHGYAAMRKNQKLNWLNLLNDLEAGAVGETAAGRPDWPKRTVTASGGANLRMKPRELLHAVIIPPYNETREVLEPTIQSVLASNYPMKQVILVLA